jgi:hypothetical protein
VGSPGAETICAAKSGLWLSVLKNGPISERLLIHRFRTVSLQRGLRQVRARTRFHARQQIARSLAVGSRMFLSLQSLVGPEGVAIHSLRQKERLVNLPSRTMVRYSARQTEDVIAA